jgi:hypothetical protein
MIGAYPTNFHEGSRSEILADYLFSHWGAVTPVRRQDDFGLDLYCTLTERIGQRSWVTEYFTVQVKSTENPSEYAWKFESPESVTWLIKHPTPLFLCTVSKKRKEELLRIYHIFPRFLVWSLGNLPERLELTPDEGPEGTLVRWDAGSKFSLSSPIIQMSIDDLMDEDRIDELRGVLAHWVCLDRENCDLVRQGLLRFRMPDPYTVNLKPSALGQHTYAQPEPEFLDRGLLRLAEALECIGGQLGERGDRAFALKAALLLNRIQTKYPEALKDDPLLRDRIPPLVLRELGKAFEQIKGETVKGRHDAFDAVAKSLEQMMNSDPLIRKYLSG